MKNFASTLKHNLDNLKCKEKSIVFTCIFALYVAFSSYLMLQVFLKTTSFSQYFRSNLLGTNPLSFSSSENILFSIPFWKIFQYLQISWLTVFWVLLLLSLLLLKKHFRPPWFWWQILSHLNYFTPEVRCHFCLRTSKIFKIYL